MAKNNNEIIIALDIGTSKVLCLVADYDDEDNLRIIGVGQDECTGLNKGVVSEINSTVASIKRAKDKAANMSGNKIESVITGIAGDHIKSYNGNAEVNILNDEVTIDDKEKVIDMAADMDIPPDQEILHVIPQYFSIDGQMGIREPVGMAGKRLAVNIHLITCSSTAKKNLNKCIENSLIDADEYVLQPVASSYSVLTEEERTLGVCLVDIGGGTTDIAIFTDGNIKHTAVVPIAGQNITKDIGIGLRTSLVAAESIKIEHATLVNTNENFEVDKMIRVPSISDKPDTEVGHSVLNHIVSARVDEILNEISKQIQASGYLSNIRAGIVFTGGGSKLNGLDDYAQDKLGIPSRIGSPNNDIGGVKNISGLTRYATAIGLILYRDSQLREMPHRKNNSNLMSTSSKIFKKISDYFKKEL
ncbi:MAG: cell division protein FtsA [Gammaproteobacteria bacterium]|jgi:cell division protein FtsA|nr:cell division protein FtsA [Gammaproteobacteria bacterium]MEC7676865.1 cell division protein FtsA [Pseudomonadota bacterium]|tara:strand:+ start:1947 stop:3197 length:1251 start_codon:yes stop_codon:yes gene_type:complete